MIVQTPDQKRAAKAWVAVEGLQNAKDFSKTCKKTASRIMTSGLGPALAFQIGRAHV